MLLGISSYSYTWSVGVSGHLQENRLSSFDLIEKAVQSGVPVVQFADNLPLHKLSNNELKSLLEYASERGIQIQAGSRGLTYENLIRYIEIAKILRSPILRMVIDAKGIEPSLRECITIVKSIIPVLADSGIRLAIENHDRFRAADFALIITETDPGWAGICLDSVNSLGAGEGIKEVVRTLAPFTINLHVKEFIIRRMWHSMGFVIEGLPAGQGMLNIPWLLDEIGKFKICESAILELWTPPEKHINQTIKKEEQWVKESIRFLQPYFN